tara:strand:+ start:29360 stop:30289 length:930 start_codon:yes stop_codon:yes gene_type:complete
MNPTPAIPSNQSSPVSRLTLGTVQFGLNYGIANQSGKPAYPICRDIIAEAFSSGIRFFDTAAAYGESEMVLGRALHELGIADQVILVSKSSPLTSEKTSPSDIKRTIEASLLGSLRHLGIESLPIYLFHRESEIGSIEVLAELRDRGLVNEIGISVDTAQGAENAVKEQLVDVIQLPYNLLDHRFTKSPWFNSSGNHPRLFARSAFLQGLLLMPEENLPPDLSSVLPVRRRIESLASEAGVRMSEICLRYCLSCPRIDSVLIGVDNVDQLKENITFASKGPLPPDLIQQIDEAVPDFPETIVRPSLWSK